MKFEHHTQEVAPLAKFLFRVGRYGLFAICLIVFSVAIGTFGYKIFAGLSWLDSFHMASMILTGMGPVVEMTSTAAKLFSAIYALYSGIAFLSITAIFFSPIIHRLLHILHVDENPEVKKPGRK